MQYNQDDKENDGIKANNTSNIYIKAPKNNTPAVSDTTKKSSPLMRAFLVLLVLTGGTFLGYIGWFILGLIVCSLPNSNCKFTV
jgi:hypothetical protein